MRVIIMNGLARKPPWGSSKMTAMPPWQGDLALWISQGYNCQKERRKEDYGRHVTKPAASWDDDEDDQDEPGSRGQRREEERRGGLQAASCKLRCAGVGTGKW